MPDIQHMYNQSLQNTHAAEVQGLQQMELQVKGLDEYPEYAALLHRHIKTTERQIARIESALEDTGGNKATLREAVTSAVGTVGAAVHGIMPDTTLKNLYAGYAFQGEQMAAYISLGVIAGAAGFTKHHSWINESLEEERETAKDVEAIIEPVTRQFLSKMKD